MWNLFALIVFEVLLFIAAYYFSGFDIMAPSCMMCIMFIISTTIALLNLDNWNISFGLYTSILIGSGLLVYVLAEIFFRFFFCGQLRGPYSTSEEHDCKRIYISTTLANAIIVFNIVILYLYLRGIIRIVGENLSNLGSYFHAYRVLGIKSLENGTSMTSGCINFALKFVAASGYLSGYLLMRNYALKSESRITQVKYIVILLLSILPSVMSGGRTGILRMLSALLVFYYISWHQHNGWERNLSWKYIRLGLGAFFILAPSFYYSLALLGRATNRTLTDYVADYISSSICLFDAYLKDPVPCVSWGEESLVGVKKILSVIGIGEPSTKYNLEFRTLGIGRSNVYTFFRRPLHDFGLIGMYIFVACIAFLFAYIYFEKIKHRPQRSCAGWVIAYGYLYYWILVSPIVQYSVNMISVGAAVQIGIAVLGYYIFTKETAE